MKKIDFSLVVIIGLAALSCCFSLATPIYSYGSPALAWSDNPSVTEDESIDVAHTVCTTAGNCLTISIENAYPGYQSSVVGKVKNTASFPINLSQLTLNNQNPACIMVAATRSAAASVDPGDSFEVSLNIQVTDQAEQNRVGNNAYNFDVVISTQGNSSGDDNGGDNGGDNGDGNNNGDGSSDKGTPPLEYPEIVARPESPAQVAEVTPEIVSVPIETPGQPGELPRTGGSNVLLFASGLSLITAALMTKFKYFR